MPEAVVSIFPSQAAFDDRELLQDTLLVFLVLCLGWQQGLPFFYIFWSLSRFVADQSWNRS